MSVDSPGIRVGRASLAVKLGAAFLILTTAAVLVVGVALILVSRQALQNSVFAQQQRSAREVALAISAYIDNNVDDLSLLAHTQNLLALDDAEAKTTLENLLAARRSGLGTLALIDTTGQERVKISQFHAYLADELVNQKETELFTRATMGQTFVSPIYISPQSGLLTVQVAIPLETSEEQVNGVLAAELIVTRLWQEVARIEIGETGYTYIVDNTGSFVAHQEPTQILQRYGEDMKRIPPVAEFVVGGEVDTFKTYEYRGLDQESVIGSLAPIASTDWAAVVEISTSEAYASLQRMQWLLIGLTAMGIATAASLGYGISRQVVQPIRNLTTGAEQIAAGNLDAELVAPQRADEIGVLANAFQKMQAELKGLYAGLGQQVTERTADLERRSAYLEASAAVGHAAASILETDQLIRQVVELIRERFDLYYVGLFLLDQAREWAVLRAGTGQAGQAMLARGHRIRVGEGMIGWSVAHAQARVALEAGDDAVRQATAELPDTRSEAALPLRSRGQVIGALTVQSDQHSAFDGATLTVLQTMADQVAVALDNARLFAQSQEALEAERRAYGEISREAWTQMARAQAEWGYRCDTQGVFTSQGDWRPEMAQAARRGQVVVTNNGTAPAVAVPLRVRDRVIGVLNFLKSDEDQVWTDDEVALLQNLAEQLSQALESARLYQETQHRAEREQLVGAVTARVRETLDMQTVLRTAADEMRQALGLDKVVVRLARDEEV